MENENIEKNIMLTCEQCGEQFPYHTLRGNLPKFCPNCALERKRKSTRERNRTRYKELKEQKAITSQAFEKEEKLFFQAGNWYMKKTIYYQLLKNGTLKEI